MSNQEKQVETIVGLCSQVLFDDKTWASDSCLSEFSAKELNDLLSVASKHGVLPIVMQKFKELKIENKDARKVVLKWYAAVNKYSLRNQLKKQITKELAGMFAERGIDMMIFKGAALAQLYPNPEWRVFSDIDFYLYGKWKEGVKVMEEHSIKNKPFCHHNTEASLNGVLLENHYDFVERSNHKQNLIVDDELKKLVQEEGRSMKATFLDHDKPNVYVMTPTMNAVFLMRHTSAHFVSESVPLKMLIDWLLFLRHHAKNVDWKRVCKLYEKSGMTEFVGIIMELIRQKFHAVFPEVPIALVSNEYTTKVWGEIVCPPKKNPHKKFSYSFFAFETKTYLDNRWKHQIAYPGESYFLLSLHYTWSVLKWKFGLQKNDGSC